MSKHDLIEAIHTLEDYGLVMQTADDAEIADALTELALASEEDGEG